MRRIVFSCLICGLTAFGCQPPPPAMPETASPEAANTDAPTADEPATGSQADEAPQVSQENLPPAEEVIENAVKALGGRDKLESVDSYYAETEMVVPEQNMTMVAKTWWKEGRFYSESVIPAVGPFKVWGTGDAVWTEDPINGLRKLEGKEASQQQRSNSLSIVADWQEHFESAETVGRRKTDDGVVVDVEFTDADGQTTTMSFDEEEWLPREYAFVQHSPQGSMPIKVYVEEFADYEGLKREKKTLTDMTLVKATTTTTKFEPNAKVPDAKLRPPKDAAAGKDKGKKADKKAEKGKSQPKPASGKAKSGAAKPAASPEPAKPNK